MIFLATAIALHCTPPIPRPRPIYTRQMRLKDSFELLGKQPVTANFLFELRLK